MSLNQKKWITIAVLAVSVIVGGMGSAADARWAEIVGSIGLSAGCVLVLVWNRCPSCGKLIGKHPGKYCKHCGKEIDWNAKS